MSPALVLDAGALIAVERRSSRVQALLIQSNERGLPLVIPTAVVAQVVRPGGRQANLRRFLGDSALRFVPLDFATAVEIGELLGRTKGATDVVDACVIACARALDAAVVTSDPHDLAALDEHVPLIVI